MPRKDGDFQGRKNHLPSIKISSCELFVSRRVAVFLAKIPASELRLAVYSHNLRWVLWTHCHTAFSYLFSSKGWGKLSKPRKHHLRRPARRAVRGSPPRASTHRGLQPDQGFGQGPWWTGAPIKQICSSAKISMVNYGSQPALTVQTQAAKS